MANKKIETPAEKRLKILRDAIRWCLNQDWSYGNQGPDGVCSALHQALKDAKRSQRPASRKGGDE